ncbi:response regulator transcription factor [Vulgatibacter incomptus]|uniref:Response regulator of two-component system n=1 Tax=Vulgatibacter incomptus TaxID=1391653 RepID=A0A0K1PI57_9BACT|nr:response regulator [Vulgatibacter incomptus]AKU92789.1 response regulator of two-component system [Vulgatibacter incomptus]
MHRHRVLLLEDEPELAELLIELLADLSYEVERAATMSEALSSLSKSTPCAIVADLTLPDVARADVVTRLRTRSKGASIVLMSAISSQDLEALGKREGVDGVIAKPFDLEHFERSIVLACRHEAREEAESEAEQQNV